MPAASAVRPTHLRHSSVERPLILVAEDDDAMRGFLREALEAEYRVECLANGVELASAIAAHEADGTAPDLIVSDLRMPGMSAFEVLDHLGDSRFRYPFVIMTAFGDEEMLATARRAGATVVFRKPFEVDDLRTAILYLLDDPGGTRAKAAASHIDEPGRRGRA